MARPPRRIIAGIIYHVLNRGNGRRTLFAKEGDFLAFLDILREALERFDVELLAWCLMPNHWHLVLRPRTGAGAAALSRMLAWVSVTHARRHHKHYPNPGSGHLYQGRYKSFAVQDDEHFLIVARYGKLKGKLKGTRPFICRLSPSATPSAGRGGGGCFANCTAGRFS